MLNLVERVVGGDESDHSGEDPCPLEWRGFFFQGKGAEEGGEGGWRTHYLAINPSMYALPFIP